MGNVSDKVLMSLSPIERKVFPVLKTFKDFDKIVKAAKADAVEVMRAVQWLENKGLVDIKTEDVETALLDENGNRYRLKGLPERRFLDAIDGEMKVSQIVKKAKISDDEINICIGSLKKRKAIDVKKEGNDLFISLSPEGKKLKQKHFPEEKFLGKDFPVEIARLDDDEKKAYNDLLKRKDIIKRDVHKKRMITYTKQGKDLLSRWKNNLKLVEKLTPESLKTGGWKGKDFRRYDVSINVPKTHGGKRHFVDQAIRYIKSIWLDMGFEEMTGDYVQTSFWDLDALFVPQDHPAREEQDTFYLKDPMSGSIEESWTKRIKEVHETGADTGSTGWGGRWSMKVAEQNLLRTHTTVLSAKTLSKLKEEDLPAKFFSVGRVFRNEALSWKHLFEFIQVEGIVVDPDANFSNLKGYLKEFFAKMGFPDVRIRPAHFPYTEPSAEIDLWHPVKKTWVEVGGSGIFRPEVTKPLLGKEVPVLAWGFGMERSIMQYYGINDIRDLYKNDLKQLREMKAWVKF